MKDRAGGSNPIDQNVSTPAAAELSEDDLETLAGGGPGGNGGAGTEDDPLYSESVLLGGNGGLGGNAGSA
jgi:hypothetical protein